MSTNENSTSGENNSESGLLKEILDEAKRNATRSGAEDSDLHTVMNPSQEGPDIRVDISTR